jgi:hypothetical protein
VARFDPPDKKKTYRPLSVDPDSGRWRIGDPDRWLPYKAAQLGTGEGPVVVAEGEKCVDILTSLGFTATTSAHGAGSPARTDWGLLANRDVVIVPDADTEGEGYATAVAGLLAALAPPARVRIARLPGLADGEDVDDWVARGGTAESLTRLLAAAPPWTPTATGDKAGPGRVPEVNGKHHGPVVTPPVDVESMTREDLGLVRASDLKGRVRNVDWLWKYRLARGEIALIAGDAGVGKSMLIQSIVATVTTGGHWPCGEGQADAGNVVIVSAEDNPETSILPRLLTMGADIDRIDFDKAKVTIRREGRPPEVSFLSLAPEWHRYWRRKLELTNASVLVVDPLPSYLGRGINDSKNVEIRAVLEPFLDEVLRPLGVCLIANTHLNKATNARTPMQRISGSVAYGAIPRNTHLVARDPDQPGRRVFTQAKCNDAPDDLPSIAYTVERTTITSDGGEIVETARPVFEAAGATFDVGAAINGPAKGEHKPGPVAAKQTAFAEWLHDHLDGRSGWSALGAIAEAAGAAGFLGTLKENGKGQLRWSGFTALYRAKDLLPALASERAGKRIDEETFDNRRHWRLLDADAAF